jgi:hypothetical protein
MRLVRRMEWCASAARTAMVREYEFEELLGEVFMARP